MRKAVPLSRNLGNLTSWNTLGPSGPVPYLTLPYLTLPYPLYKSLGGNQGPSERVGKNLALTGVGRPCHPARNEQLYPLRYPGPKALVCKQIM